MSKTKLPLSTARTLAEKVTRELAPYCRRIEIAGSVRREKAQVGDLEIVCVPLQQVNLFGDPGGSLLDPALEFLVQEERIIKGDKWGAKYKKFHPAALPGHLTVGGCRLWQDGAALETPEERDFLEALGVGWVEPGDREEGRFEGIVKGRM